MTYMKCADCKFFYRKLKQCRRHPPLAQSDLERHVADLVRHIAWSLRLLAKQPDTYVEGAMEEEAHGVDDLRWPYTDEDDFCGEFQPQ